MVRIMENKIIHLARDACYSYWSKLMQPLTDKYTFWNLRTSAEQLAWIDSVKIILNYLNDFPNITSKSENAMTKEDVIRECIYGE